MCSDGAAALVLVSGAKALELGLTVIAKISGYADAAHVCVLIYSSVDLEPSCFLHFRLSLQFRCIN